MQQTMQNKCSNFMLFCIGKFEEREDKIPKFQTLMQQLHWKLDVSLWHFSVFHCNRFYNENYH